MPPFEQYLISRQKACYKAPYLSCALDPTPECVPDKYTDFFRKRWDVLAHNPCRKLPPKDPREWCKAVNEGPKPHPARKVNADVRCEIDEMCLPPFPSPADTHYNMKFKNPLSIHHRNIDDCCKAPCPCDAPKRKCPTVKYECTIREPLPPLDDCTVTKSDYCPKCTPPPPGRHTLSYEPYDPCCCPTDDATMYRLHYPHKKPVPNGPVFAAVTDHGLWSMDQFSCAPLAENTEYTDEFPEKCDTKRSPIYPIQNLFPCCGPFARASETCYQFGPKFKHHPPLPEWILKEPEWQPPCTPLDDCTTYEHFYQPYPFPKCPPKKIKSPGAIPFPTWNDIWYTCCDPKVDQTPPVEILDNEPWPYVVECPIKYQDTLMEDPCAPFRDETTYKADYWAKKRCVKLKNFAPCQGYTLPIQPFIDDTTNRCSFPAYTREQYKNATFTAGNPCGKFFGPFTCPPKQDKCLPPFPAPYGHPLKPYTKQCPCGPFDDRSTYHTDFKFRSKEMVQLLENEMCQVPNVPKGVSLYRFDYVKQDGKRAERMPPPKDKGYRCICPNNFKDYDTIHRRQYLDFWNMGDRLPRQKLQLYRGKRTDEKALKKQAEEECCRVKEDYEIIATPPGTTVEDVLRALEQKKEQDCCLKASMMKAAK